MFALSDHGGEGGGGGGGVLKNSHELLDLTALKMSMFYKNYVFQCMGQIFCVEFQKKCTFEIPHKILYPYIERFRFYPQPKI